MRLSLTSYLEGIFLFCIVLMAVFVVWKLMVASKGLWTRVLGLVVLVTCTAAYFYPNLLGE